MTCVIDNACNLDYHLALSVATCSYNEDSCATEEWDDCSKRSAPSRSSWEGSAPAASCSSCAGAFSSGSLPLQGPALPDKVLWAAWEDDRTTQASPRSTRSLCDECDEPDDFELPENELAESEPAKTARKLNWAELVDTDTEDDDTSSVDADGGSVIDEPDTAPAAPAARWADIAESEEEFMEEPTSQAGPTPSMEKSPEKAPEPFFADTRAPRTSRRARAARGANAAADDQRDAAPPAKGSGGKGQAERGSAKGAGKSAGKGLATGKGAGKSAGKGEKGSAKGSGKAGGKGSKGKGKGEKGAGKGGGSEKYQCQIVVGIEEDNKFRVVRRLIGSGGENMKNINQQTDAKLRLRGRGSKFLEGDLQQESTDDLMLCISAQDKAGYETAKTMAYELIEGIQHSYRNFCHKANKVCPDFNLEIHEGYREGSR